MKCTVVLDDSREEIIIYAKEKTTLIEKIEQLASENETSLLGYKSDEIIPLEFDDVYCFVVENNKVYAVCEKEKYLIKQRLYKIEQMVDKSFIKLNQSSIANIKKIKKFDTSIGGALKVVFKNDFVDYVSRRNIKNIKERLGF